jgi:hypothetical protein
MKSKSNVKDCNCVNYKTNTLKDKIVSAFVWAFWIAIGLWGFMQCSA